MDYETATGIKIILILGTPLAILYGWMKWQNFTYERELPAERARWARREAEQKQKELVEQFTELFGFKPEYIYEYRYQKEIIVKLSLMAIGLKEKADDAKRFSSEYRRDEYRQASTKYAEALSLIGHFDPDFQKDIPHWTELPEFVKEWLAGKKFWRGRRNNTVTAVIC